MTTRFAPLDKLPLFPDEESLSAALLGAGKIVHWRQIAPLLEADGFPKVDALMGGRYAPAVRRWFDDQFRLTGLQPTASRDGPEALGTWKKKAARQG